MIDLVARAPLWQDGLDYRHGTGHGVGHFLNVHEGPQSVSPRITTNEAVLTPGMVISNGKRKLKERIPSSNRKFSSQLRCCF